MGWRAGAGSRLAAAGRAAAVRLIAGYLAFCWRTTRWRVEGGAAVDALLAEDAPFLAAFWHGRLAFSPLWAPPGRRCVAMISAARDGELFARVAGRFGIETIRGSSADPRKPDREKGGRAAAAAGLRALRAGAVVAIAVDGPRGPRERAQPGVAALAAAAKVAILPIAFGTRRGRLMNSWDRFLMPLPFDRGAMVFGPAMPPPDGGDPARLEAHRAAVDAALNAATARADRLAGRAPPRPD